MLHALKSELCYAKPTSAWRIRSGSWDEQYKKEEGGAGVVARPPCDDEEACWKHAATLVGVGDGDTAGADLACDFDVFRPVDGEDVGAVALGAVDPDHVDSSAAGAEGFHEGGIIHAGRLLGDEQVEFRSDDVLRVLRFARLRRVGRHHSDADFDVRVEKQTGELRNGDADAGGAGKAFDHFRVVPEAPPGRKADREPVGHHAGLGRHRLDQSVEFGDRVGGAAFAAPLPESTFCGNGVGREVEHGGFVGDPGAGDQRAGLGLLEPENVPFSCLAALVIVDRDLKRVRIAVEKGIFGGEVETSGRAADGAARIRILERVFVGEVFVLSVGGLNNDFGREEGSEGRRTVLREAPGVVGEGDVILRTHQNFGF